LGKRTDFGAFWAKPLKESLSPAPSGEQIWIASPAGIEDGADGARHVVSMKVVGANLDGRRGQRRNPLRANVHHTIVVLQRAFHDQEA